MKIFVLFPGAVPQLQTIQNVPWLADCEWVLLDKIETLSNHRAEKGVVLIGGDPARVNTLVGMARTLAPMMGCVAVLEKDQSATLEQSTLLATDVLLMPAEPVEIYARLNAASALSEMRWLLEESGQLDEVTELYNAQFFYKRLGEEMSLSRRHGMPVTCAIFSISFFEVYIDTYGFGFVTELIRKVAGEMRKLTRKEDLLARLGNNEIGILLPRTSEKGAISLAQRILKALDDQSVEINGNTETLTINGGLAAYPNASEDTAEIDPDTLIRFTRHALHLARCSDDENVILFSSIKPQVS